MRSILLILSLVLAFALPVNALPASGSASTTPYTFRQEWAFLAPQQAALPSATANSTNFNVALSTQHKLPEGALLVAVIWLEPQEGYHTYSNQPGEGAMPTRIIPTGEAKDIQVRYMPGEAKPDIFDPDIVVNVYEGATPVFLVFPQHSLSSAEGGAWTGELSISMLACSETRCFPVKTSLTLSVPPSLAPASQSPWFSSFLLSQPDSVTPEQNVTPGPSPDHDAVDGKHIPLLAPDPHRASETLKGTLPNALPLLGDTTATPDAQDEYIATAWNFAPQAFQASLEVSGLGKAVLFGLLAGLILNVMPCVLPVITFKISALLAIGGTAAERRRKFREHNLLFSAGILTWFIALALLFSLADMAWGQIFQNPKAIFGMLLLVFCLGLAMFDVFHLPVLDLRLGAKTNNPRLQAYSTGLLATLLATPCSGPLLGGVLGWSLMQSLPVLLVVFISTGIGMAAPYLLMAFRPAFAARLPHPGPWMQVCERILGFFLMGTCIYLLSILPTDHTLPALAVLLVAAAAAWVWGRWGSLRGTSLRRTFIAAACLLCVSGTISLSFAPTEAPVAWQPYQEEEFRSALGKKNMLLEFTADWCPTCRVLERTVLTREHMQDLVKKYDLTLIQVDMTFHDPGAQDLLRALDSASIPLLAIFPAGDKADQPVVLRDIYTYDQLKGAVKQAMSTH